MNSRRLLIALAAALALAGPAGAEEDKGFGSEPMEMKSSGTPGTVEGSRTVTLTSTVKALDVASRQITLVDTEGKTEESFKVGPAVKNLDQIHVGDQVVIEYVQGLMMEMQPAGEEPVARTAAVAAQGAAPGAKPAGGSVATVQGTVTITAIDMKNRMVEFQGPAGGVHKVQAGPDVHLEKAKVGDKLVATYTEAMAIKVEPAKKAN